MKLRTFRMGGVHPEENKLSSEVKTVKAPLPEQAVFPLSQHIGAPAKPVVAKGDSVKVGTMIAEAGGFVSAPIFSSVSGTVLKIDNAIDATSYQAPPVMRAPRNLPHCRPWKYGTPRGFRCYKPLSRGFPASAYRR